MRENVISMCKMHASGSLNFYLSIFIEQVTLSVKNKSAECD